MERSMATRLFGYLLTLLIHNVAINDVYIHITQNFHTKTRTLHTTFDQIHARDLKRACVYASPLLQYFASSRLAEVTVVCP